MTQVINQNLTPSPVEVGKGSESTGDRSTAVGVDSQAVAQFATAFGDGAQALNTDTTAIGAETTAPANWNTVIGYDAGSLQNGENIVLIGRKSEGQGDDAVAIGENARANGLNSTVVGKATSALGDNSSAFGQGALVTSSGATVVGQGVSVDAQDATSIGTNVSVTGKGATGVGNGAIASAEKATALGNGAEASGINSLAIGTNSTTNQDNTFSFGNRNLNVPLDKSLLYPKDAGTQTLVKLPVSSSLSAGIKQEYIFDIGGKSVFSIAADSDGDGSVQNPIIKATDADISLSTGQSIKDGSGADRITLDSSEINVEGGDLTVDRNGDSADATLKLQSDISGGQEAVVSMFSGGNEVWRAGNNAAEDYIIETPDNNNTWLQFDKSAPRIDFSGIAADLRLATGQSIEDGSGTRRVRVRTDRTQIFDDSGDSSADFRSGNFHRVTANSTSPFQIFDAVGVQPAVQYDTDPTTGVLRTPNAGMRIESNGTASSGSGLELESQAIRAFDRDGRTYQNLSISGNTLGLSAFGGLVDMTGHPADLRLATGQAIEDGGGNPRLELFDSVTVLRDENGFDGISISQGSFTTINTDVSTPFRIYDQEGEYTAVKYKTSASAPGTLQLTNADLDINENRIRNELSGARERIILQASDSTDSGNITERISKYNIDTSNTIMASDRTGLLLIRGQANGEFMDLVLFQRDASPVVVASQTRNNPPNRDYSTNFQDFRIRLSSGSGVIVVKHIQMRVQ